MVTRPYYPRVDTGDEFACGNIEAIWDHQGSEVIEYARIPLWIKEGRLETWTALLDNACHRNIAYSEVKRHVLSSVVGRGGRERQQHRPERS